MNDNKRIAKLQRDIEEILGRTMMLAMKRKDAVVKLVAVAHMYSMERLEEGMREYMRAINSPAMVLPLDVKFEEPTIDESKFRTEYNCIPLYPDGEKK